MFRCKYPKYVRKDKIDIVEDEAQDRCYQVSFDLQDEGSNVLVISRAPRLIEKNRCNSLYKRIIKVLEEKEEFFKKIKRVTIVNLFSIYETSREDLYEEYLLKGREYVIGNKNLNDEFIKRAVEQADYIIVAWGDPIEGLNELYGERVEFVLTQIRDIIINSKSKKLVLTMGKESKKGYPKHCFAWSYKDELKIL